MVVDPSSRWSFQLQPDLVFFGPPGPPSDGAVLTGDVFTDDSKLGRCDVTGGIGSAAVSFNLAGGAAEFVKYGHMPTEL